MNATPDYGAMLRSRRVETLWKICLKPSLLWDRSIILLSKSPDAESLAALDEQIRESTVVVVLRALTQDETDILDTKYGAVEPGTKAAQALDRVTLVDSCVRWETLDGDLIEGMGADDMGVYWDAAGPGERVPLMALSLQLRTFSPTVPF